MSVATTPLPGEVLIGELLVHCIIGILPDERDRAQRLLLNVAMEVDMAAAAASDNIADTVNYAAVAQLLSGLAEQGRYHLVEAYLAAACRAVLAFDKRVRRVRIEARKPDILPNAAYVGAVLECGRD